MDPHEFLSLELGGESVVQNPFELSDEDLVGQSIALAVQDAVSHLRSIEALSVAVTGVALNGLVSCGDPRYRQALGAISAVVGQAAANFSSVTKSAEKLLRAENAALDDFDEIVTDTFTEKVFDADGVEIDERTVRRVTRRRTNRDPETS